MFHLSISRMFWSFFFSFKIWPQNQLFRSSGLCNLQRPSFDGILKKSSQQVWEQKWEKYVISEEKFIWNHLLRNVHSKWFPSSLHRAFGINNWNYLNMTLFPWFLSHFFPLSFWLFFWFPFDTFPDFPVILFPISPSPAPELASWVWLTAGEGVLCVWGCSAKEVHTFFECCGPFYFPLKFGCKTNYFASQVFAVCHFVRGVVSGWGLLCKRNTNPAFAGQLTKKFNFLIRENLTWTNDCPLVWENENI